MVTLTKKQAQWLLTHVDSMPDNIYKALAGINGDTLTNNARAFINYQLKDGPKPAHIILQQAHENRISRRTLYRVAESMHITKTQLGFGKAKQSYWSIQ